MPEETDIKQEAGTVSNSSSTDLLAMHINPETIELAKNQLDGIDVTKEMLCIYAALIGLQRYAYETSIEMDEDGFHGKAEEARVRSCRYGEVQTAIDSIFC